MVRLKPTLSDSDIPEFKCFTAKWDTINLDNFVTGISSGVNIQELRHCRIYKTHTFNRDDYKESLGSILIFFFL